MLLAYGQFKAYIVPTCIFSALYSVQGSRRDAPTQRPSSAARSPPAFEPTPMQMSPDAKAESPRIMHGPMVEQHAPRHLPTTSVHATPLSRDTRAPPSARSMSMASSSSEDHAAMPGPRTSRSQSTPQPPSEAMFKTPLPVSKQPRRADDHPARESAPVHMNVCVCLPCCRWCDIVVCLSCCRWCDVVVLACGSHLLVHLDKLFVWYTHAHTSPRHGYVLF